MISKVVNIIKSNYILLILLLIAVYIRFFAYPNAYIFSPDATRDAIIGLEGAKESFIPLVGPFSSTGPFTFGPWYFISLIGVSFIFYNPFSPWIMISIISIITVIVMYDIGRLLGSKKLSYILGFLVVFSPSQITAGTMLSNISPVSFFAALTLWTSISIFQKKSPSIHLYFLLGLFLGLGINAHYQTLGLVLLPILVCFFSKKKIIKNAAIILLGLFITFIPLLLFNLYHNWHTLNGILEMYLSRDRIYVPNSWKIYIFHFWPSLVTFIFGTQYLTSLMVLSIVSIATFFLIIKKKLILSVSIPLILLSFNFIQLRFYWGERSLVYHYFLEPYIIFMVGFIIYRISQYNRLGLIIGIITISIITTGMVYTEFHRQELLRQSPNQIVEFLDKMNSIYPNKKVIIYKCNTDVTYRAEAISYLKEFVKDEKTDGIVNLGIVGNVDCKLPNGASSRSLPVISGTPFVDITKYSASDLEKNSWSEINTKNVYIQNARWY